MCGEETNSIININMKPEFLCNKCSFTISMQTVGWLINEHNRRKKNSWVNQDININPLIEDSCKP